MIQLGITRRHILQAFIGEILKKILQTIITKAIKYHYQEEN